MLKWGTVFRKFHAKLLDIAGISPEEWSTLRHSSAFRQEYLQMQLVVKRVEVDRLLLGGAVILVAARTALDSFPATLIDHMAEYSHVASDHLTSLADIIFEIGEW